MDDAKLNHIEAVVARHWPESIAPDHPGDPALWSITSACPHRLDTMSI